MTGIQHLVVNIGGQHSPIHVYPSEDGPTSPHGVAQDLDVAPIKARVEGSKSGGCQLYYYRVVKGGSKGRGFPNIP